MWKGPKKTITTELEARLHAALKRISEYQSVPSLLRYAEKDYGVSPTEAIEMAYENVLSEAKHAIKGLRKLRTLTKEP